MCWLCPPRKDWSWRISQMDCTVAFPRTLQTSENVYKTGIWKKICRHRNTKMIKTSEFLDMHRACWYTRVDVGQTQNPLTEEDLEQNQARGVETRWFMSDIILWSVKGHAWSHSVIREEHHSEEEECAQSAWKMKFSWLSRACEIIMKTNGFHKLHDVNHYKNVWIKMGHVWCIMLCPNTPVGFSSVLCALLTQLEWQ